MNQTFDCRECDQYPGAAYHMEFVKLSNFTSLFCTVRKGIDRRENGEIEQTLARSRCHKGRLLYYFAADNR